MTPVSTQLLTGDLRRGRAVDTHSLTWTDVGAHRSNWPGSTQQRSEVRGCDLHQEQMLEDVEISLGALGSGAAESSSGAMGTPPQRL